MSVCKYTCIASLIKAISEGTEIRPVFPQLLDAYKEVCAKHAEDTTPVGLPLTVAEIPVSIKYMPEQKTLKPQLHQGQRKLFLVELQFITEAVKAVPEATPDDPIYIIYAGAAPGMHTILLSQLFPMVKLILIDPVEFKPYHYYRDIRVNRGSVDKPPPTRRSYSPSGGAEEIQLSEQIIPRNNYANFGRYSRREQESLKAAADKYGHMIHYFSHHTELDASSKRSPEEFAAIVDTIKTSTASIFIMEEFYTTEHSRHFRNLGAPTFFISDIRTTLVSEHMPSDIDIIINNAQQYVWVKTLQPHGYSLKFRFPYYDFPVSELETTITRTGFGDILEEAKPDIDFVEDYKKKVLHHLPGEFYLQAFPPKSSIETRLTAFPDRKIYETAELAHRHEQDYEDRLFFHNAVFRGFVFHNNPYTDPSIGFDDCYDCTLEAHIWEEYKKHIRDPRDPKEPCEFTIPEAIQSLVALLGKTLITDTHGRMFRNAEVSYCDILQRHNPDIK